MWCSAFLATAVALLPGTGAGHAVHDPEEIRLQKRLWELEGELWESEQDERQRIHRHHHHRGPLLGLLRRRGIVASAPDVQGSAHSHAHKTTSRKLPSTHPAMRNLKNREHVAADARSNLEGNVNDAMAHLNSVAVIKSKVAKTEVQIRVENRKLKKLEEDRHRLDMTHRSLSQSLKRVMEPKLAFAEERLHKRQREVQELQAQEAAWKQAEDKFHASSLAMIKQRGDSKANLEAAVIAEERAHQDRLAAEKQMRTSKRDTNLNVQNYRYSETEERATRNKEKHGEEEMRRADAAVKRLSNIMHAEQSRVDESMALGKDRVEGKIRELEDAKKKSSAKLSELKREYSAWQDGQLAWRAHLASVKEGTQTASQNYADAQEAAFAAERKQIVHDAEKRSDWAWDDWPGMDDKADVP